MSSGSPSDRLRLIVIAGLLVPAALFGANWILLVLTDGQALGLSKRAYFNVSMSPPSLDSGGLWGGLAVYATGLFLLFTASSPGTHHRWLPNRGSTGVFLTLAGAATALQSSIILAAALLYFLARTLRRWVLVSASDVPAPEERFERNIGRLAMILLFAAAGFVVAEMASRWLAPQKSVVAQGFPTGAVRYPKPYVMFGGLPNAGGLNRFGYRGPAPSPVKPTGEFRLFVLGGSTVFNGSPGIAGLLQERLHADGLDGVRAFNYGVVSSVSGMDLARVVYEVADHSPDFVLFYNGGNDILHPWGSDQRPGFPFNFVVFENNPLLLYDVEDYPFWTMTTFGSNLFRHLRREHFKERFQQRKLTAPDAWPPWTPGWEQAIGRHYAANAVKAARFARAFGAGFAVVIQPLIYTRDAATVHDRKILSGFPDASDRRRRARRLFDRLVSETRRQAGAGPLTVLELGGVFDGLQQPIFTDEIHITQEARNIVADAIYREIGPLIRKAIGRPTSTPVR